MKEKTYHINLPQTDFPMKANGAVRELDIQQFWDEHKVYEKNVEQRSGCEKFVLHDGPPYLSSGRIHIGTALNKVLKDIVTKYKALRGFYSPYVPGYDSHGLPIENAALKDVKGGRAAITPLELRRRCRDFALSNLTGQEANFRRLGVWGDWEHPYITLDKKFEAAQIRVFGKMATAGYLYKGLKSVQWCPTCETALAEAEVEYADHSSNSIYVQFDLDESSRDRLPDFVPKEEKVAFVIWTTTPWTLPANLGLAVHPEFSYDFIKTNERGVLVVANALKDSFLQTVGLGENAKVLGSVPGALLEHMKGRHPFIDRASPVVLGDHVTADTGTGVVHTAPGHGPEDFELGQKYKLGVISPVNERGIFTEEAGQFQGLRYDKANPVIVEHLKEVNKLLHHSMYTHSYPHCWRCKKPLIFRATEQWFASVDGCRQQALEAIDSVEWLPASGKNRIYNMVENRTHWCISRQRAWGVPIPVFYCAQCGQHLMTAASIERVASVFSDEGSDSWWEHPAEYFLRNEFKCTGCGSSEFIKETDIMDVWFDSGSSHAAVLDQRPELRGTPCELYLEGSDQHRGWFQSSLLTSVATNGIAPYKTVLTHGFVVDESGKKMSKSLGNVVEPDDVIKQYGADVLRLWVASVNYTDDVPIGKNMLAQLAGVYGKLRNTARYLLGNLHGFDPATDRVPLDQLNQLDSYILHRLHQLVTEVAQDFDRYEFFKYYQLLQNFCAVELSSFYFDIAKDVLYTNDRRSVSRRSIQTVLEEVLYVFVRLLVPVTPHLAEDIFRFIPEAIRKAGSNESSVLLTDFPASTARFRNDKFDEYWPDVLSVRNIANKALEQARSQKKIGAFLEAQVVLTIDNPELAAKVQSLGPLLAPLLITSQAKVINKGEVAGSNPRESSRNGHEVLAEVAEAGVHVCVLPADGTKCPRCWKFRTDIGSSSKFPELCSACAEAEATFVES